MGRSIELTAQSLNAYGEQYKIWAIAFSGGKDSSTVLTLVLDLIDKGLVQRSEQIYVLYADTRQELPPLHFAAMGMLEEAKKRGCITRVVMADLPNRFWPYILGHGVPSPNNGTMRWCTPRIKVEPMKQALADVRADRQGDTALFQRAVVASVAIQQRTDGDPPSLIVTGQPTLLNFLPYIPMGITLVQGRPDNLALG
jgi:3'-phosphoadenosine 5'-phosphosulfate sulfotransferase (PAPS reductase)/FAD synthetase